MLTVVLMPGTQVAELPRREGVELVVGQLQIEPGETPEIEPRQRYSAAGSGVGFAACFSSAAFGSAMLATNASTTLAKTSA